MKILSTKKLKSNQRDLLLGSGCSVVDYNAIAIKFLDFEMPQQIENAIFTSQNGVKAFFKNCAKNKQNVHVQQCFCVGQKTEALLRKNGLKVAKMTKNASELGNFIVKQFKNDRFYYFCGNNRRDELPAILKTAKITLFEIKTYKTELKPRKFDQKWDGILFFSPSGVQSFVLENKFEHSMAFCIGETTATAARKYTNNVTTANATSVESVIAKVVKTFKKYD